MVSILRLQYHHFLPLLSLIIINSTADTFSPFTRYDLSYEVIQSCRKNIIDTSCTPFFSLFTTSVDRSKNGGTVNFSIDDQSISLDLKALAGFEYFTKSNRFGVVSGELVYCSPLIKSCVSADIYSTEHRVVSPTTDIQFERFIKENSQEPVTGMFDFRANIRDAYIQIQYKSFSLITGKQKLRWGPGYKGTLGLSGTIYSPLYFYNLNLTFGSLCNMKAFLCGYEDESIYRKELMFPDDIVVKNNHVNLKTNLPRYGAGQRFDIRIGKWIQLGIYELVDFFGSNELNRFANPLQFYFLSNETSGTNNANLFGGIDFNIFIKSLRIYGEFINDDITIFEKTGNPDKYGLQLGAAWYGLGSIVQTGIEYTHLSRYIYGHSRVMSRHALWGESIGWPWGNNQDVLTIYSIFCFSNNINIKIESNYWLQGNTSIENDWYADGKPDLDNVSFFPEHATKIYSAVFSAEYTPFTWLTCCCYWEPVVQHKKLSNGVYTYCLLKIPNMGFK